MQTSKFTLKGPLRKHDRRDIKSRIIFRELASLVHIFHLSSLSSLKTLTHGLLGLKIKKKNNFQANIQYAVHKEGGRLIVYPQIY